MGPSIGANTNGAPNTLIPNRLQSINLPVLNQNELKYPLVDCGIKSITKTALRSESAQNLRPKCGAPVNIAVDTLLIIFTLLSANDNS